MKPKTIFIMLSVLVVGACTGCTDNSGATQQMPPATKASTQGVANVPTGNLPPQALDSLKNANSKK